MYNAKVNDKEFYFFRNSEFHVACTTISSRMKYNDQIYCNMMFCFSNDVTQGTRKSSLLL